MTSAPVTDDRYGKAATSTPAPLFEVRGLSKTFGGTTVLHDVSLTIRSGEVRALLGHNGSGKSTLIKILAGYHRPDTPVQGTAGGQVFVGGDYASAYRAGLRFVHQDLGLVESLDTVDNLALGSVYPARLRYGISWRTARKRATVLLESLGYDFPVTTAISRLTPSQKTGVAIARAVQDTGDTTTLLVLDEPTAALPVAEASKLFDVVRRLAGQGLGVLYVTHHLDEVFALADSATVLRDGRNVFTGPIDGLDHAGLVELMLGGAIEAAEARDVRRADAAGPDKAVLRVQGMSTETLQELSFSVAPGEVVGVAGITGSGRDQLLEAVAGVVKHSGVVDVGSTRVPPGRVDRARKAGLGFVPADRVRSSVFQGFDVTRNLTAAGVRHYVRLGFLNGHAERAEANVWVTRLGILPANPAMLIESLSGGNQQKTVVARWLAREPRVLVLVEPTQGVDVGAREAIYGGLRMALSKGTGVLVASSDADELASLCDRVLVLRRGRIVAELAEDQLNADNIERLSIGGTL